MVVADSVDDTLVITPTVITLGVPEANIMWRGTRARAVCLVVIVYAVKPGHLTSAPKRQAL